MKGVVKRKNLSAAQPERVFGRPATVGSLHPRLDRQRFGVMWTQSGLYSQPELFIIGSAFQGF
jgi:hypothetical protein